MDLPAQHEEEAAAVDEEAAGGYQGDCRQEAAGQQASQPCMAI